MGKTTPSLFLAFFDRLQVTKTYIKAWMSFVFGQIPSLTTALAALKHLKLLLLLNMVDIDLIVFKLAGNKDMHNIMDDLEVQPDQLTNYWVSCH